MKMSLMSLAVAAGAAGLMVQTARADDPVLLDGDAFRPVRVAGYVYVNLATGEVNKSPVSGSRIGEVFWQNDDVAGSCNMFLAQDDPGRDETATGRKRFGSAVVNWGDTNPGEFVDGYEVGYATNIGCDTAGAGISGLNMVNVFIDDYDGELDPGGAGATGITGWILEAIAGGDCTLGTSLFQGWIYTVDLEGTGYEFNFGTTDVDSDGLHDFAYSYEFQQDQSEPKGIVGPMLVRPASLGGAGSAIGCVDALDWFNQTAGSVSFSDYFGAIWFGGGDCSASPPRPYASVLLNVHGGHVHGCDPVDYTRDGIVDFSDYLEFLNRYDAQHPSADLNQDGFVDFGDYLEFLNLFAMCGA